MTKTLLFLTLILFAPVAGASTYRCATKNEAITTHSEYDVARFIDKQGAFCRNMDIDQPAEEAKEESIQEIIALGDKQCTGDFTPWFTPYFDGVHMTISIKCVPRLQAEKDEEDKQSDAEKWKELCDKFIEAVREGVYDQTPVNHMKERLDFANLLCTRYTAAILEEMRNK